VEAKKQTGRTRPARLQLGRPNLTKAVKTVRKFINSAVTRATQSTQRTQRFIRWVRVRIYQRAPWSESLARLRHLWTLPPGSFPTDPILADLYARRWDIELKLRDLKTTLGMERVEVKRSEMAHKIFWVSIIAFNPIRSLIQKAAAQDGLLV
jgi:hypothetical protein